MPQEMGAISKCRGRNEMPKYAVYGIITASVKIGEYEAKNEDEALEMADFDESADWHPSLCWQCSEHVELADIYETQVDKIEE